MRIDPKTTTVTPVALEPSRNSAAPRPERQDPAAIVKLSQAGAAAVGARASDPEEKVARLRAAIERGDYRVDLDRLAAHLVDDGILGGAW